jgi:hypothetical protein
MKNLIITGVYELNTETGKIDYTVFLYGQTAADPAVIYIKSISVTGINSTLEKAARAAYCEYYKCDDFNIISITNLIRI